MPMNVMLIEEKTCMQVSSINYGRTIIQYRISYIIFNISTVLVIMTSSSKTIQLFLEYDKSQNFI